MRNVEAYDLELFAINSRELYEQHKSLARMSEGDQATYWVEHVRNIVRPLYCRQVERVALPDGTALKVAARLAGYYRSHVKELGQ